MNSNISNNAVNRLLVQAKSDGIKKFVVAAVILLEQGFLLLERNADDFMGGLVELPSGTVDPGEGLLEALEREALEETGLTITDVNRFLSSFDYKSGSGKPTRQFNFSVSVKPAEIKLDPNEHVAFHVLIPTDPVFSLLNISEEVKAVLLNQSLKPV